MIRQLVAGASCALWLTLSIAAPSAEGLGAIGDSISTAMNADDGCDDVVQCLENLGEDGDWSFVTGVQPWSIRIRLQPFGFSDSQTAAVNGANWVDALFQAQELMATSGISLVVVELGGNDVCQSLGEPPPSLDWVEMQIDETLTYLTDSMPGGGNVVLAEVPNVVALRELMAAEPHFLFSSCQTLWDLDYESLNEAAVMEVCADLYSDWLCATFPEFRDLTREWLADLLELLFEDIYGDEFPCANVLNSASSAEARAAAADFNLALNVLLTNKADEYSGRNGVIVRVADGIYEHPFSADEVSGLDCFHPSRGGQAFLADLIWPTIYDVLTQPDCSADGYCNPDCRRGLDPDCKKGKRPKH
jgi:lysophospholipase L1-like esterase